MSQSTNHNALALLHHPQPPTLPASPSSAVAGALVRDYRKGNWTLHETLVLIAAKRLDDERRRAGPGVADGPAPRTAEQRWKWVENHCWRNACLRSQNQCNDKWDNLLRDYKKVRGYEARAGSAEMPSYWAMERHERKERNLPTNLAAEVFDSLTEVLGRRAARRATATAPYPVSSRHPLPPPSPARLPQPPSHPPPQPPHLPPTRPSVSETETLESEENGEEEATAALELEPEPKRLRLGSSVVRSATVLARALLACEEKRDRRHRELVELEERRLRLEQEKTDTGHQGFAELVSAVNNLSGAIHALVADRRSGENR